MRPVVVTIAVAYEPGAIPGGRIVRRRIMLADDTPELLAHAFKSAQEAIEEGLRNPMRPCGYPGPWA